MKKICVAGLNPSWQKTLMFEHFERGGINRASSMEMMPSGKGINFARAVKNWGLAECTVFQFLAGDAGKRVRKGLWQEKIANISVETPGETRTCTTALSASDQVMTELIEPAPAIPPMEAAALFESCCAAIPSADALAVCGTYPPGINEFFYARTAAKAREHGKFILVDAFKNTGPLLEDGADLLKINLDELRELTGKEDPAEAFRTCFERYAIRFLAVTDGPAGAWFAGRSDGQLYRISVPDVKVVNPIGSGDTCSGVTLSCILDGLDPLEAFRQGLAAATANCMTLLPASFEKDQALALLDEFTVSAV